MAEIEDINAMDLFIAETNHEDLQVRIESIKKLPTVAVALGVEQTKSELMPYLKTLTETIYSEDEILLHLAQQLGNFLPYVGGPDSVGLVLDVLERLSIVEETIVRERAVESLQNIASNLDTAKLVNDFIPLILRLADSEWFTSKSSATGLFAICYPKLPDELKSELRTSFRVLSQDDSPLVRRAAATRLTDFVKVVQLDHLKNEFVPVFDNLSKDDQDSVRVLAVDVGISISFRLKKLEVEEFILKTFTELFMDLSWRVRYQVASQINKIQLAIGPELTRKYLLTVYQNLVRDTEPQVREAAARNIVSFCQILQESFSEKSLELDSDILDPIIINQILPLLKDLDQDVNQEVKEALSSVITSLSPLLGQANTKNLLLPIIISSLMNDSSKVRENIITNLNSLISVIDISDVADPVLKIIIELVSSSASVWRTRRNLIVTINYIAKHSGKDYFDTHLKEIYEKLLGDGVYAVRKTAPLILPILVKNFGTAWALESIIPTFLEFVEHKHYLYRYVCLFCIDELVTPTLDSKSVQSDDDCIKNCTKYLNIIRDTDTDCSHILINIDKLNRQLKNKLSENWTHNLLQLLDNNCYTEDKISNYAEDTMEMFTKDSNCNIMTVTKEEIEARASEKTYIEGVLEATVNNFLDAVSKLSQDSVFNVQLRAGQTLKRIIIFHNELENEMSQEWVRNIVGKNDDNDTIEEQTLQEVEKTDEPETEMSTAEETVVTEETNLNDVETEIQQSTNNLLSETAEVVKEQNMET